MVSKGGGRPVSASIPARCSLPKQVSLAIACILCVTDALAGNWTIVPRVIGSETYSDNVTAAHSNTQSDLITEISPGISISGDSSRAKLNLDYQLQSLFFANDSGRNDLHQNLAAIGQTELVKDLFFVDGTASISQQIINAQQNISLDNISASGNRTDVNTYSISPNLRHDFSGYANGTLRYTHDVVDYGNATTIQNSSSDYLQAALASGRHSGLLGWNLNYNDQRIQRGDVINDVTYKSADGELRYQLNPKLSAVMQGGREDNQYSSSQPIVNGNYWAAGLDWVPSRYIKLRGLEGSSYKTAAVTLTPNERTNLAVSFRDRAVGLNPGPVWSGNLTHSTLHTVLDASYLEDTVTNQQLASDLVVVQAPKPDPVTGEPLCLNLNNHFVPCNSPDVAIFNRFTLTNEIIARKRAAAGISYIHRKSTIRLSGFDEQRVYQLSLQEERARGIDVSWGLQLTPRSRSLLTVGTQRNTVTPTSQQNEYFFIQMGLTHELGRDITSGLDYRFFRQNSDNLSADYHENRLTARIIARF